MTDVGAVINDVYSTYIKKATQSDTALKSNNRAIYLNENYRKRQAEYNILLFYTLLGFFIFLILVAIKRFFPVIPSRVMDFLIVILFFFIFLFIGYKIYDIQRRYILNFDELDIPSNIKIANDYTTKGTQKQINQGSLTDMLGGGISGIISVNSLPYGYRKDIYNKVIFDTTNFKYSNGYIIPKDMRIDTLDTLSVDNSFCFVTNTSSTFTFSTTLKASSGTIPARIYFNTTSNNFKDNQTPSVDYLLIISNNGFNIDNLDSKYPDPSVTPTPVPRKTDFCTTGNIIKLTSNTSTTALTTGNTTIINGKPLYFIKKDAVNVADMNIGDINGPYFILRSNIFYD